MNYSIDIINQIAEGSYQYEIDGINAICVNLGGVGGHTYTIDALNELCTLQGVASGHSYNIDALNAICSGAYMDEYSAWVDVGTKVNQKLTCTLTSTGTGAGVSTLRLESSETQIVTIISGNAKFYTDASCTLGESTTWTVTAGALRTIYLKAPSGNSTFEIPKQNKIIKFGNSSLNGWESSTNAARLTINTSKLAATFLSIEGTCIINGALPTGLTFLCLAGSSIAWTYNGALPTGLTYLYLAGSSIAWTYNGALPTGLTYLCLAGESIAWTYNGALPTGLTSLVIAGSLIAWTYNGALPTGLTYLYLDGSSIAWSGLNVGNNGNVSGMTLINYRITKMSSVDMVTFLTHLKDRTGSLPNTITINDYADYESPPASVTDAIAALKLAKPNITTVNLGA